MCGYCEGNAEGNGDVCKSQSGMDWKWKRSWPMCPMGKSQILIMAYRQNKMLQSNAWGGYNTLSEITLPMRRRGKRVDRGSSSFQVHIIHCPTLYRRVRSSDIVLLEGSCVNIAVILGKFCSAWWFNEFHLDFFFLGNERISLRTMYIPAQTRVWSD